MFREAYLLLALLLAAPLPGGPGAGVAQGAGRSLLLATTTSTRDTGLLEELLPRFEAATGIAVKPIAAGTGAALRMAARGDADAVLVHAPEAERAYVESGDLVEGRLVMHNDFVLLGPPGDPAGARRHAASLGGALAAIAAHGRFVSRGDDSGTHQRELALWRGAGIDPASIAAREETGQGMGATLHVASERRSYTLADRGTWLAERARLELAVVHEGGEELRNVYHAYLVSPARHPGVHAAEARAFLAFLTEPATQRAIGAFRREELGEPLFVPDALPASTPVPAPAPAGAGAGG